MATNEKKPKQIIKLQSGLEVPRIDVLTDLLIRERKSVLFVGEGNFSFTVAFAALRESERRCSSHNQNPSTWDGIVAIQSIKNNKPMFSQVVNICKESCQCMECDSTDSQKIELERRPSKSWKYNIDACHFK